MSGFYFYFLVSRLHDVPMQLSPYDRQSAFESASEYDLGLVFSNFRKRYIGDDWIVECLDFALGSITELDGKSKWRR